MEKIPAPQIAKMVADLILEHMMKYTAFSNTSITYYGCEVEYKIDVTTYSRGEKTETISQKINLGVPEGEKANMVVQGRKLGGKKPKNSGKFGTQTEPSRQEPIEVRG
jgi:hypothetical protein